MWNMVMTVDNVARTRTFFTENVAARGILPLSLIHISEPTRPY